VWGKGRRLRPLPHTSTEVTRRAHAATIQLAGAKPQRALPVVLDNSQRDRHYKS
jgi:hypothetical protein